MAKKPIPVIDPRELYEKAVYFTIYFVDNNQFGKFVSAGGLRCQAFSEAVKFDTYEEAEAYIEEKMLEGVSILKVWA